SLHYYETTSQQAVSDTEENHLVQIRKATALVAAHIVSISEELETVNISETDVNLRYKLFDILRCIERLSNRMAVFIITPKPEDELLRNSRIRRLKRFTTVLKEHLAAQEADIKTTVSRICHLSERSLKLIASIKVRLDELG